MMDQWLARKLLEQDRKIEAVSRGGIGIGNSSVTGGSLEVEGEHAISLSDGGINYIAGPPPPKPTAPTLQAGVGSIFVTWDGLWAEANDADETELDTEAPLDFDRIEVHCSTDPAEADWGEDTMRGEIKAKAGGTVMVRGGDIDDEVFVCLIGLSKVGEHGEASDTSSIIIEGIDIAAITSELDAANVDLSNLNGDMFAAGAEIDAAKIALKNVDLAVISTDDGTLADALSAARDLSAELANQAKADAITDAAGKDSVLKAQIDGTIAQARTDLEGGISSAEARAKAEAKTLSDAARDSANTFTSTRVFGPTQIADNAITTAKLAAGSVEADKIKAGAVGAVAIAADSVEGRHVKANAITADKVLIGGERNLIPNGDLSTGSAVGWMSAFTYQATDVPPGFAGAVNLTGTTTRNLGFGPYPVEQGDSLQLEMWIKADKASSRFVLDATDQANVRLGRTASRWTVVEGPANSNTLYAAYGDVPTQWTRVVVKITIPAGVTAVKITSLYPNHSSGTERTATLSIAGMRLYKQAAATFIADGAITTDKILADAITANKVAANAIGARAIAADAIEAGKIAANAVTSREIVANAITAEKIVSLAVTTEKLAALAVSADKIAANAVVAGKIAANAVTAGTIAALAVTADKIAANAITADKIAANAVTAGSIQAGAINGMKIVGPDIYTSETGNRAHIGGVGIELYGPNDKRTFFAETATGDVSMTGRFFSNDAGLPRVEIDNDDWASIGIVGPDGVKRYTNGAGIRIGATAMSGFSIYHGHYTVDGTVSGQAGVIDGPLGLSSMFFDGAGQVWINSLDSNGNVRARVDLYPEGDFTARSKDLNGTERATISTFTLSDYYQAALSGSDASGATTSSVEVWSNGDVDVKANHRVQFSSPEILGLPMASGTGSTGTMVANTPKAVVVKFPTGRFKSPPVVMVTPATTVPGTTVTGWSVASVTATQCTVYVTRTNTTSTSFHWFAVESDY